MARAQRGSFRFLVPVLAVTRGPREGHSRLVWISWIHQTRPMKNSLRLLVAACLPLAAATAFSQGPFEHQISLVRMQVEWIELAQMDFTELTMDAPKTDTLLRETLSDLIKKDKASILEAATVTGKSGQRSKVETVQEMIYPSEYDPPFAISGDDLGTKAKVPEIVTFPPAGAAFETRNVGTVLEADPVIGPGV